MTFKNIPISLRLVLILSFHLSLGLPKDLFPAGVPVKILKALLYSSILARWPVHLKLRDLITLIILGERYKLWSSSLWSDLHSPFASILGPNIRLRILFSYLICNKLLMSMESIFNIIFVCKLWRKSVVHFSNVFKSSWRILPKYLLEAQIFLWTFHTLLFIEMSKQPTHQVPGVLISLFRFLW